MWRQHTTFISGCIGILKYVYILNFFHKATQSQGRWVIIPFCCKVRNGHLRQNFIPARDLRTFQHSLISDLEPGSLETTSHNKKVASLVSLSNFFKKSEILPINNHRANIIYMLYSYCLTSRNSLSVSLSLTQFLVIKPEKYHEYHVSSFQQDLE